MAYATAEELAAYLGVAAPADAERLLARASDLMDVVALKRIDITDSNQTEQVMKATCAQVEYWLTVGEEVAIQGSPESVRIGNFSQTGAMPVVAPRAKQHLFMAGLLSKAISAIGTNNELASKFFYRR